MGIFTGFIKSWKKSGKLRKLQYKIAGNQAKNRDFSFEDLFSENENLPQRLKERENLLNEYLEEISLNDEGVRSIIEKYGLTKKDLHDIYVALNSSGLGQWVKGHYIPLSTISYFEPLFYLVESERRKEEWAIIVRNIFAYWSGEIRQGQLLETLNRQFDEKLKEEFEEICKEYYRIGFEKIPDEFFSTQTREKAERLFQEGLSEKIGGLALQKMTAAAELGHLQAIRHLKDKGFRLYINHFNNKIHFY